MSVRCFLLVLWVSKAARESEAERFEMKALPNPSSLDGVGNGMFPSFF